MLARKTIIPAINGTVLGSIEAHPLSEVEAVSPLRGGLAECLASFIAEWNVLRNK